MRIIFTILLLLVTCYVHASNEKDMQRQVTLDFLNTLGDFNEMHSQFINATKGQFDLYLENNQKITEKDIEPYKSKIQMSKDEYLDFNVKNIYEEFTTEEIVTITKFFKSETGLKWLSKKNILIRKNMKLGITMYMEVKDAMDRELKNK